MVNHGHKWAKLGRDTPHRLAMLRNMVTSLFQHERIITTHTKAKAAQRVAERLIATAKHPNQVIATNKCSSWIKDPQITRKLVHDLVPRYANRPGGCTRVAHLKERRGDNAPMSILELVDREGEIRPAAVVSEEYHAERQAWLNDNAQYMTQLIEPHRTGKRPGGTF